MLPRGVAADGAEAEEDEEDMGMLLKGQRSEAAFTKGSCHYRPTAL